MLDSTDAEGIIGVLAWSTCDREGRRRFSAIAGGHCEAVCDDARYAGPRYNFSCEVELELGFLDVVAQSSPSMPVESFFEDEGLAKA